MTAKTKPQTLPQIQARLAAEQRRAYLGSRYATLSMNVPARFSRDKGARPGADEILLDASWPIRLPAGASPLAGRMAEHLREFLVERMNVPAPLKQAAAGAAGKAIVLSETGGGDDSPESFTIEVAADRVAVAGRDAAGLRDGIVRLADLMGLRQGPILQLGRRTFRARLPVRLAGVPLYGTLRDLVFLGNNAVMAGGGSLYALSLSDAIPELAGRREPDALPQLARQLTQNRGYGLKNYAMIETRKKFPKDDPVFRAHPDIRGALTWKVDGEYVLCTEHPRVRRYLSESMAGLFRAAPELDGAVIIIGGEGFYHCFMRPYGVPKGHSNCPRCERIGGEAVVANLCNALAEAVRQVNPAAEIIAWPYSAVHVWSADETQEKLIQRLRPGTAILTEVEKDEYLTKPLGVRKHLWDYSIDLPGLGERARRQVAACKKVGIPIYLKSEPEATFECPGLSHVPALDRWLERAEAMAGSGSSGSFNFPCYRGPIFGTSVAEVWKLANWSPAPPAEEALMSLARRIAGDDRAGQHLRLAWKLVSQSIEYHPEIPPYYIGPYYLGPAQPMCADPRATVPPTFYGQMLYQAEMTDDEGLKLQPTFLTSARGGAVHGRLHRQMQHLLRQAVDQIDAAGPLVPARCRTMFGSEASAIRWLYHAARTQANFSESCQIRDGLVAGKVGGAGEFRRLYDRWLALLKDEKANAQAALPVMEGDVRLDFYFGGDHAYPHGADMIRAKIKLIDAEIKKFLPSLKRKWK